jgi:hypothetical protein
MATQPNAQTQDAPRLKACGYCWNCNLAVDDKILFCEPFCEEEYASQHPGFDGSRA